MKTRFKVISETVFALGSFLVGSSLMATPAPWPQDQQPPSDNTKMNRDQSPTADDQKMNPADREIAQKIRKSIHEDKTLSTYAHNIKIISQDGKVTLRGPVRSDEEKANLEAKAVAVAGSGNVTNRLEIAPAK